MVGQQIKELSSDQSFQDQHMMSRRRKAIDEANERRMGDVLENFDFSNPTDSHPLILLARLSLHHLERYQRALVWSEDGTRFCNELWRGAQEDV